MKGYLENLLTLIQTLPGVLTYILLGLGAFLENVFPPMPGDTITAFGAFLVGTGKLGLLGVYVSTTSGSLAGFMSLFLIGRFVGRPFLMKKDYRFFRARDIAKAEERFRRYGYLVIALNRFLPGLRSVISIAGGISGLKTFWVALLALLSSAAWNLIWIYSGYMLGSNWDTIKIKILKIQVKYNLIVLISLAIVVVFVIIWKRLSRKRRRN